MGTVDSPDGTDSLDHPDGTERAAIPRARIVARGLGPQTREAGTQALRWGATKAQAGARLTVKLLPVAGVLLALATISATLATMSNGPSTATVPELDLQIHIEIPDIAMSDEAILEFLSRPRDTPGYGRLPMQHIDPTTRLHDLGIDLPDLETDTSASDAIDMTDFDVTDAAIKRFEAKRATRDALDTD